ncbi:MAG: ankyrin repeat domain-containing protein [Anaerolineaceae bacterium]|nr:ankyrin repeat domain-containing protein [Anaerolineaceae bacterium]
MTVDPQLDPEIIREFVIASHFNLEKVKSMLSERPALLMAQHQWGENDFEDGLGAASHVGNRPIAEFFLEQGVPLSVCAAAMLGRTADVAAFIQADPSQANAQGAHRIPILFHAALSGDTALTTLLRDAGCKEGYDSAIHAAIMYGHADMVDWLLHNGARDLQVLNYEGKTPLQKAIELNQPAIIDLLRARGAVE